MIARLATALLASTTLLFSTALAAPATRRDDLGVTALPGDEISTFSPFTLIASAAYCAADVTSTWTCGSDCEALPGFHVTASGGDGGGIQYWFVAYSEASKSVVVAHQGTDPTEFLSVLTDLKFFLEKPNATLFPGVSENVMMHGGFLQAYASTADIIFDKVQQTMQQYNTTIVHSVGHSLGGALALLEAYSLRLRLPEGTTFKVVTYGMPRVGNQDFADAIDKALPDLTRITNKSDPIPIVPGRRMGFVHPHGEVHIDHDNNWIECPGQDSEDPQCTVSNVSMFPFQWNIIDHLGYYGQVVIQCWGILSRS
ncbi:alpha/beta-hydrolase [Auriculariales sp. MPI-PUGE-AT-0066]|nr:alpha/beta-hydrolase [Auriculariales sp. MPI-PUGE-AT-0066]